MEINIKKVHTLLDIAISIVVFSVGVGLYFVLPGWGVLFCLIGILLLVFWKRAFKRVGEGTALKEAEADVAPECRDSIIRFLDGKGEIPRIIKAGEGDHLWIDVYFNKDAHVAYAQLYDVAENSFEPATAIIELRGKMADDLISALV